MKKHKIYGFTLVELIVVITILAILGTIAFLSFQGYNKGARDSVRTSDLSNIEKGLSIMLLKSGTAPIPDDNKINIIANGVVIGVQGYAGKNVNKQIGMSKESGKDPLDNTYYTYLVNSNRTQYQLLGFLEGSLGSNKNLYNTYAVDYSNRNTITKGSSLGVLLGNSGTLSKIPLQDLYNPLSFTGVDIVNTNNSYSSILDNTNTITGTGNILSSLIYNSSCKRIKDLGGNLKDGIYTINPTGSGSFSSYCDMNNGGRDLLFSVNPTGIKWAYNSSQWTNPVIDTNLDNFITTELTSKSYSYVKGNEVKLCRGDLLHCYIIKHNMNRTLKSFYIDSVSYVDFSRCLKSPAWGGNFCDSGQLPQDVGIDNNTVFFSSLGFSYTNWYPKFGVGINISDVNKLGYQADNNNDRPGFDNEGSGIGNFRSWNCGWNGTIIDVNRARSVERPDRCAYLLPDDLYWYVFTR